MKSRILICGGRDWHQITEFNAHLQSVRHLFAPAFCVIEGGATGVDTLARNWAKHNGLCCMTVRANWDLYGNRAGSLRNTWMLQFGMPDLVIAFPGGVGTNNMVQQAKKAGIDVWLPSL
jgi:predicted Rossmann-fold nucleotide-binding protein